MRRAAPRHTRRHAARSRRRIAHSSGTKPVVAQNARAIEREADEPTNVYPRVYIRVYVAASFAARERCSGLENAARPFNASSSGAHARVYTHIQVQCVTYTLAFVSSRPVTCNAHNARERRSRGIDFVARREFTQREKRIETTDFHLHGEKKEPTAAADHGLLKMYLSL